MARVFVIDPDPLMHSRLAKLLGEELGCSVRCFGQFRDARDAAEDAPPDAVLAEWGEVCDDSSFWDAVAQSDPDIVRLAITDDNDIDASAEAISALGPLARIGKPINGADAVAKVASGLERRRLSLALKSERGKLKASKREAARATERLVEAEQLAAVGRVVNGIAHEIGNQLALVGYARAIRDRVEGDAELTEFAEIIVAAQKRLAATVEQIRDFASGQEGLVREPADVAAVVDEAIGLLQYDSEAKARRILRDNRDKPLALLHHEKFSQVVLNLVSNAVLATQPGDDITVTVFVEGGDAVLQVSDGGAGMPEDVLRRLGEPFFTTRGDRGAGLGVGICMRIVEEHGGQLTFKSELGKGTTARVQLPALEAD